VRTLARTGNQTLATDSTLADPVLEIRPLGAENIVATNDDWRGTAALKAAFTSVGAFTFPSETSRDAAPPSNFSPAATPPPSPEKTPPPASPSSKSTICRDRTPPASVDAGCPSPPAAHTCR